MNVRTLIIAALTLSLTLMGCDKGGQSQSGPVVGVAGPVPQTVTSIMNSADLDLSMVADLIRSGKVRDADSLQAIVNDPNTSINDVDLDHDGQVDPITVSEVQTPTGKQFNLVANPATQPATTVANIDITQNVNQTVVQAGYPSYVAGYQTNYYTYTTPSDLAFMMWAFGARPIYVASPYRSYGWYAPHTVWAPDVVTQRRTTYETQTHVSPVQKSAPPQSFSQKQAQKVPSGFQTSKPAPTTNNLNDRGTASDFKTRDSSQPVQKATGFGAKTSPAPAPTSAPVRTPTPTTAPKSQSINSSPPSSKPSFKSSSPGPRTAPRTKR